MKIIDKEKEISIDEAFRAMVMYLDMYYKIFNSDLLGNMLSDLQVCVDGKTADPAAGAEWLECLEKAIADESAGRHTIDLPWRKG